MTPRQSIIYLIRHATPDWSRIDIPYHLPPGPPLTLQGEDEAMQLGLFLCKAGVRQLYTSPLERASRTASIASLLTSASVQNEAALSEWQPVEDAIAIRTRCWPVWEMAKSLSQDVGPIGLVTHGGPIAVLLEELGLHKDVLAQHRLYFDNNNPLPPAGAWKITCMGLNSICDLNLAFMPHGMCQWK